MKTHIPKNHENTHPSSVCFHDFHLQERPGASRSVQKYPEAPRSTQKHPEAPRSTQKYSEVWKIMKNHEKSWKIMKNHDFHLKNGSRLIFHRSWPISTKKFRLMKKKISQKNPKKFFSKFCIHQNASKMHILAGRGVCAPKVHGWVTTTKVRRRKYIRVQYGRKVYCDRQYFIARHARLSLSQITIVIVFPRCRFGSVWLCQTVFGFAKLGLGFAKPKKRTLSDNPMGGQYGDLKSIWDRQYIVYPK